MNLPKRLCPVPLLTLVFPFPQSSPAPACSRVFWPHNPQAKVVARPQDLYIPDQPKIYVFPRGMKRDGRAGENSLKWTSRFGSVVITAFDLAVNGRQRPGVGGAPPLSERHGFIYPGLLGFHHPPPKGLRGERGNRTGEAPGRSC